MREFLFCEGCGHSADGLEDLVVLDSFAAAAGPDPADDLDVLLVQCRCGDRAELPVPAAA
jgi:hypothetical protein